MATTKQKLTLAGIIGASAASALIAFTGSQEGLATTPYPDKLANDVMTVCYGDTAVEMREYTTAECAQLLEVRLAVYAAPVKKLTPGFDTLSVGQKVAVIDFAYNVGVGNYASSTLRGMFSRKEFPAACAQFTRWKFTTTYGRRLDCSVAANGCSGLWTRRKKQQALCLS